MSHVIFFPLLGDPWLDNGLEALYRALGEVKSQIKGAVGELTLCPDGVEVEVMDLDELVRGISGVIRNWSSERLYYWVDRRGERRQALKQFVTFNCQPASQYPKIFVDSKRDELIKAAFSPGGSGRTGVCPVCGEESVLRDSLTQSVHPMATKIKSLSGVRTSGEGGALSGFIEQFRICPRCYLRGAMVWLDDGLIYRTGRAGKPSFVILPSPPGYDLLRINRVKERYRVSLRIQDGLSNVKAVVKRAGGESEEMPPAGNSLLLAFLERLLSDIIAERRWEGFMRVRREISEGWLMLTIPIGPMKNVTARDVMLDERVITLIGRCVEDELLPYAGMISLIWLVDERAGKLQGEETDELREEMSRAVLEDDFDSFASFLIPRPRRSLVISRDVEGRIEGFTLKWRCGRMDAERLEVVKRAGRALGQIAIGRGAPTLLYALERARSPQDLLDVLAQVSHRIIGLDAEGLKYLSVEGLERLTEIVHQLDPGQFNELRNTLMIFASLEWARRARQSAAQETAQLDR